MTFFRPVWGQSKKVTFEQLSYLNFQDANSLFELLQQSPGLTEKGEEFKPKIS